LDAVWNINQNTLPKSASVSSFRRYYSRIGKELGYWHGCQGLENSIHPNEWNADDADCADTHGFEVSTSDISFLV
jgi:hypothetical protein